jgi:hypothetical protein
MVEKLEEAKVHLSERDNYGDQLFEKWSKKPRIGEGMDSLYDKSPEKARGLSVVLENQENYLRGLNETQISNDFQTTPENVIHIVRLGYPNSMRGEVFHDFQMATARDSVYYLKPVYASAARGTTASNVTHENASYRYATEIEEEIIGSADSSTTAFSATLTNGPLCPYSLQILSNGVPIASDDGSGTIAGTLLDSSSTNTIVYSTGAITVTFTTAPTAGDIVAIYHFDSEVTTQYTDIKAIEVQLTDYQLRARPYPLYVSWSKMAELLLGTTLGIDVEAALIQGAADELKKSLDFLAVKMAYRYSGGNTGVTFNADFAQAGADSEVAHMQSLTKTIEQAGQVIYDSVQRGGVTALIASSDVVPYLTLHNKYTEDGKQPEVGIYRVGTLLGKPVYKAPAAIVPSGKMLGIWKNPSDTFDVSLVFGTLIPLYQTQTLEYKNAYKETGLYSFGDWKCLQSGYMVRMTLSNI